MKAPTPAEQAALVALDALAETPGALAALWAMPLVVLERFPEYRQWSLIRRDGSPVATVMERRRGWELYDPSLATGRGRRVGSTEAEALAALEELARQRGYRLLP